MARPTITPIAFNLFQKYEKRVRTLRFDINALADFEQLTGMGFGQLMTQRAVFATTRAMLYAGLKHEDRTLTLEKVGELMFEYTNDEDLADPGLDELMTAALDAAVEQGALGKQAQMQRAEARAKADAAKVPDSPNGSPATQADSQ